VSFICVAPSVAPSWAPIRTAALVDASLTRLGQTGRNILRIFDGHYYSVVFAVGQVDDYPGVVAVADGERDALVLMEAPHPDAWKLRASPLQAVNLGNAVRHCAHAADRAPGECLNSVGRLKPLPARHIDRDRFIGNQQVRHETVFWRALPPAARCCAYFLGPYKSRSWLAGQIHGPGPSPWERVTGIEPALSAWEADVLPLNYTRAHRQTSPGGGSLAVLAQTSYRNG
jgi:hypothetical protein